MESAYRAARYGYADERPDLARDYRSAAVYIWGQGGHFKMRVHNKYAERKKRYSAYLHVSA